MFGIIVLLHNPGALELEVTNWRPDILLQDFQNVWFHQLWASCPGPEAAKQPPVFAQSLSYCWIMNLNEASEACSSLDVVLCSFMTSWMSRRFALGVFLVGQPLLGRFTTVPNILHLWIMALTVVRCSPKALEMALTLYRYMSTIMFLICSWISLDRGMMCCSLRMLHFFRQVLFKWFLDSTGLAVIRPGFG